MPRPALKNRLLLGSGQAFSNGRRSILGGDEFALALSGNLVGLGQLGSQSVDVGRVAVQRLAVLAGLRQQLLFVGLFGFHLPVRQQTVSQAGS